MAIEVARTDLGALHEGDAAEFLGGLEPGSATLVFADPPYGVGKAEWDGFASRRAYVEWSLGWIRAAHAALDPAGSLYVCGYSEILADLKWACGDLFAGCRWLVWFYRNKGSMARDWGRSHESLLHLRKGREFVFNMDAVRVPYNAHTLRYPARAQAATSHFGPGDGSRWTPHPGGARPKDVFEIPTLSNSSWERTDHPTQKPVELVRRCVLASSSAGDLVVDPFSGSGTTALVAEALGRRWAACDREPDYNAAAAARLADPALVERVRAGGDAARTRRARGRLR